MLSGEGRLIDGRDPAVPLPSEAGLAEGASVPRLRDLVAAATVYAGVLFLVSTLIDDEVLARAESEIRLFFWLQTLDDGLLAGIALAFGRLRYPGSWAALGLRGTSLRWWAIGFGGGVVAAVAAWAVGLGLQHWGWQAPTHPVESVLGAATGPRDVLVILLAVTVPVPLAEEAFFRGLAYRLLRARFGVSTAIVVTSLAFALVHGLEPGAWIPVLPVGLVLALLVERSGSLWPAVVGHAVVNGLAVLVG